MDIYYCNVQVLQNLFESFIACPTFISTVQDPGILVLYCICTSTITCTYTHCTVSCKYWQTAANRGGIRIRCSLADHGELLPGGLEAGRRLHASKWVHVRKDVFSPTASLRFLTIYCTGKLRLNCRSSFP